MEEAAYYLEQVSVIEESEDDYPYEEVLPDDYDSTLEGDEDLEKAVHAVLEQTEDIQAETQRPVLVSRYPVSHKPEVVDDFLRNFLIKMGMMKTLDCFQTEWYEMMQKDHIKSVDVKFVPDAYTHNQLLHNEIGRLKKELDKYKEAAINAKKSLVKLQKERDFHRMHHKRVVQEKNRLINDLKRLKRHYASYEPALKQLNEKYQTALKQKLLISLERDRAVGEVTGLQATLKNILSGREFSLAECEDAWWASPKMK